MKEITVLFIKSDDGIEGWCRWSYFEQQNWDVISRLMYDVVRGGEYSAHRATAILEPIDDVDPDRPPSVRFRLVKTYEAVDLTPVHEHDRRQRNQK